MRIVFLSPCLPTHVTLAHVRYPVTPFKDRPIQCSKCGSFGNRRAECRRSARCSKCASGSHTTEQCKEDPKCANCGEAHPFTSTECPNWKRECAIKQYQMEKKVDYITARTVVCSGIYSKPTVEYPPRKNEPNNRNVQQTKTTQSISGSTRGSNQLATIPSCGTPQTPPTTVLQVPTAPCSSTHQKTYTAALQGEPRRSKVKPTQHPNPVPNNTGVEPPKQANLHQSQFFGDKSTQASKVSAPAEKSEGIGALLKSISEVIRKLLQRFTSPYALIALKIMDSFLPIIETWCG